MSSWVKAVQALGVPYTPDVNTRRGTMGVTELMTFVDPRGHRSSGATAYLTPGVLARKNLTVLTATRCLKVLLTQEGGEVKAVGVLLADEKSHARTHELRVSEGGEVVLCAGTINTPQLLLLSGLGPKDELEKVGLECVEDLPAVGKNLQDVRPYPSPPSFLGCSRAGRAAAQC
jgi:choline dehydrogenase